MTEETAGTPTNAPEIIYLQDGGGDEPLRSEFYHDQVTWCADSIADNDTKYIRFDVHEREVAALTTQRDELQKRIGYTAVPSDKSCESPPSRESIIEECAQICDLMTDEQDASKQDSMGNGNMPGALTRARQAQTAADCATAIRALKTGNEAATALVERGGL